MKPPSQLLLFSIALGLASRNSVGHASAFNAQATGALDRTLEGSGQARALVDLLNSSYALELDADGEATISFNRALQLAPGAGTYAIAPDDTGGPDDEFETFISFALGTENAPGVTEASGVLTIVPCSPSQNRGRFDLTGQIDGEDVLLTGTFDAPRGRDVPSGDGVCR